MNPPASFQEEFQMSWSVLIVDDEPMTQDLLRLMLEPAGFRVTGADHGLEALQKVQEQKPDILSGSRTSGKWMAAVLRKLKMAMVYYTAL